MSYLAQAVAVAATLAGAVAALCLLVLLMASAPNGTPEFLARLKWGMIATSVAGVAVFGIAMWLTFTGKPLVGGLLGASPILWIIGLFIWVDWTKG